MNFFKNPDKTYSGRLAPHRFGNHQRNLLFENTARAMGDAPEEIKVRHILNCSKADPAYGEGVAAALGIAVNEAAGKR